MKDMGKNEAGLTRKDWVHLDCERTKENSTEKDGSYTNGWDGLESEQNW